MQLLDGKVVLISGAGPGLGLHAARQVLASGALAVLTGRNEERVGLLRADVDPHGEQTAALGCDIRSLDDCRRVITETRRRFGRLDGVVHVAAADRATGGLLDSALAQWPEVQEVNVEGTLQLTREAVPLLAADGGGSVVIIGSTAAIRPRRNALRLAYGLSKAALAAAVPYLATELGPHAIRVNNLAPGLKYGPAVEEIFAEQAAHTGTSVEEVAGGFLEQLALPYFATDDDVARTAVFLLSDWSRAITGQTLVVDAGLIGA